MRESVDELTEQDIFTLRRSAERVARQRGFASEAEDAGSDACVAALRAARRGLLPPCGSPRRSAYLATVARRTAHRWIDEHASQLSGTSNLARVRQMIAVTQIELGIGEADAVTLLAGARQTTEAGGRRHSRPVDARPLPSISSISDGEDERLVVDDPSSNLVERLAAVDELEDLRRRLDPALVAVLDAALELLKSDRALSAVKLARNLDIPPAQARKRLAEIRQAATAA